MAQVDKQAIANAFGRAAQNYSRCNDLQRLSANMLLSLLNSRKFTTVLDAGCGPGNDSLFWRKTGSQVIALDLSIAMLIQARNRKAADIYLVADIESLPIANDQFDLVWSHLAIQWCDDLLQALTSLYRVARPGGKIAFTTLLSDSLYELKQAWYAIDKKSHVNNFLTQHVIEATLAEWCYRSHIQIITLYFANAQSAMHSLKGVGANYLINGRSQQPLTKKKLKCLEESWPREIESYPLTYQLFHGVIDRE